MKTPVILLGLLIVVLVVSPLSAQVYKWVDKNGVTRYSDSPPPDGGKDYETREEIAYDEEADRARTADDKRAVEEYTQMKAQEEQLEKQMEEAKAQEAEAEKIDAIKAEQEKIKEELATKTRHIRGRARRDLLRLRNIEKQLAALPDAPENAAKRAELEAEKQSAIESLMQHKRYFQAGGRQLVQEYEELEKELKAYE